MGHYHLYVGFGIIYHIHCKKSIFCQSQLYSIAVRRTFYPTRKLFQNHQGQLFYRYTNALDLGKRKRLERNPQIGRQNMVRRRFACHSIQPNFWWTYQFYHFYDHHSGNGVGSCSIFLSVIQKASNIAHQIKNALNGFVSNPYLSFQLQSIWYEIGFLFCF